MREEFRKQNHLEYVIQEPCPAGWREGIQASDLFSFEDWFEPEEAAEGIRRWIQENGIPLSCLTNVTSYEECQRNGHAMGDNEGGREVRAWHRQ